MEEIPNLKDIIGCLSTLGPFVKIAGLMFVYGKVDTRLTDLDSKLIQWVQCFCGPQFHKNITVVTTQWDVWSRRSFREAWKRQEELKTDTSLKQILDPPGRFHGGYLYNHGVINDGPVIDPDQPVLDSTDHLAERAARVKSLVKSRYGACEIPKLQILSELKEGKALEQTEAAKVLLSKRVEIEIIKDRSVVRDQPDGFDSSTPKQLPPGEHEKGWWESTLEWVDVLKHVALFFRKAKEAPQPQKRPAPQWTFWGAVSSWWSGEPPDTS